MESSNGCALSPSAPDYVEVSDVPDYTVYQPDRAKALLDSIGLAERDSDGFRVGPDGEAVRPHHRDGRPFPAPQWTRWRSCAPSGKRWA